MQDDREKFAEHRVDRHFRSGINLPAWVAEKPVPYLSIKVLEDRLQRCCYMSQL